MGEPAIRVANVWKRFGARDALASLSFEVAAGTCCAVFGSNGSGKTTLVRALATLAVPSEGAVRIAGCDLPRDAARARARVGVVIDHPLLPRDLTLEEGLLLHAELFGVEGAAARVRETAERMGLGFRLRDPVRTLSRGMGQRAAVARALLHDPEVLLLDEPFTALDADGCRRVEDVVRGHVARGRTALVVSHDVARTAALAEQAIVLEAGRKVADGRPDDVLAAVRAGPAP